MAITMSNFADVQKYLSQFVTAAGVTPALAPHGVFYHDLNYSQFTTGDVPGVAGYKILEVGNSAKSNIIMALAGTPNSPFDPNSGTIGQMPQPSPPYDSSSPTESDIISALSKWIDAGCPNANAKTAAAKPSAKTKIASAKAGGKKHKSA